MKCEACGFDLADKFVRIIPNHSGYVTNRGESCDLYGCPVCGTVRFEIAELNDYAKELHSQRVMQATKCYGRSK